eukprot:gene23929-31056_t
MPTKFPLNNVTTSLRRPTSSPSDISGTTSKLANAGRNSTISASTSWVIAIIVVVMVTCVAVATYCFYARDSFLKKAVSKLPFPCKKSSIFPGHNNAYAPSDENEASDSQMRYPKPQLNSAKSTIISLKFENGNVEDGIDLDRNVDENFEEFFGDLNEKVVLIQTNELKKLFKEFESKSIQDEYHLMELGSVFRGWILFELSSANENVHPIVHKTTVDRMLLCILKEEFHEKGFEGCEFSKPLDRELVQKKIIDKYGTIANFNKKVLTIIDGIVGNGH